MYNPRKINLYLEDNLPTYNVQQGGMNMDGLNSKRHKYIRAENSVSTDIFGATKIEKDVQLWFEIDENNIDTDEQYTNINYLERTTDSILFSITYLKSHSNVIVKGMPTNTILKLFDLTYCSSDDFIYKWKNDKKIFESNIPNIYMYGDIYTSDNVLISNYYITDKYKNHISLLKLDYEYTIKYIVEMLLFIEKCIENNIVLKNFKFSGIGYNFINSQIKFVLADYNDTSMIKKDDEYFKLFDDGCDAMTPGVLVPYFIISDFFEMNTNWIEKLDKLYVIGLAESLIFLLYEQNEIMTKFFEMLYNPSHLKQSLHYYHYMKLFDELDKQKMFFNLFNSLKPKFIELEPTKINPMFKRIIINCFETKYNAIKSPNTYLHHIKEAYDYMFQLKSSIKTYINPIGVIKKTSEPEELTEQGQHHIFKVPKYDVVEKYKENEEILQSDLEEQQFKELSGLKATSDLQDTDSLNELKRIVKSDDIKDIIATKTDGIDDIIDLKPILKKTEEQSGGNKKKYVYKKVMFRE